MPAPLLSITVSDHAGITAAQGSVREVIALAGLDAGAQAGLVAALTAVAAAAATAGGAEIDVTLTGEPGPGAGVHVALRFGGAAGSASPVAVHDLARLSHDLRTPLYAARGIVESVLVDRASDIDEGVGRDLKLIDQVLDEMLALVGEHLAGNGADGAPT